MGKRKRVMRRRRLVVVLTGRDKKKKKRDLAIEEQHKGEKPMTVVNY